jgi:cell division septum initiation protein DivIVA
MADLSRTQELGVGKLGSGYARRGLANSGVFQRAQNDYASNWARQNDQVQQDMLGAMRQYELQDQQAWADYYAQETGAETDKWADILATAAQLQSFRSYMGG